MHPLHQTRLAPQVKDVVDPTDAAVVAVVAVEMAPAMATVTVHLKATEKVVATAHVAMNAVTVVPAKTAHHVATMPLAANATISHRAKHPKAWKAKLATISNAHRVTMAVLAVTTAMTVVVNAPSATVPKGSVAVTTALNGTQNGMRNATLSATRQKLRVSVLKASAQTAAANAASVAVNVVHRVMPSLPHPSSTGALRPSKA